MGTVPPFRELIAATASSAVHLEMRDSYAPDDRSSRMEGRHAAPGARLARLVRPGPRAHRPGRPFRRARIVSEPVSDYIRFEHEATAGLNVAAGEEVRWLPRRRASDLCLPGNDFWLFDDRLIRFHHFDGDGRVVEDELCDDPAVIRMCSAAFEAVWERAVPHADYRLA